MVRLLLKKVAPLAAVLMTAALWGCGPGEDKGKTEKKADAPPPPKAAPAPAPAKKKEEAKPAPKAAIDPAEGWTLLAKQEADLVADKDRVRVGGKQGRFKELRVAVEGAPVTIEEIIVTFGNDKQFRAKLGKEIKARSASQTIDLPGETRVIKNVEFVYRTSGGKGGKGTVLLYGR
jgi:hypothetical protein